MKTNVQKVLFGCLALAYSGSAWADIDAVAGIASTLQNVQAQYEQVQTLQESVTTLKDTVTQGVGGVLDNVKEFTDIATNPGDFVKSTVMGGVDELMKGSKDDSEAAEDVKKTYNRQFGEENNIEKSKKLQATINKNLGENVARLYGRTLVMRQELLAEKNPKHSLKTIDKAMRASTDMMLTSMKRWNRILEMQAYINEYKNSIAIQNFTVEEGEGDE